MITAQFKEQALAVLFDFLRTFVAAALTAYLALLTEAGKVVAPGQAVLLAALVSAIPVLIAALRVKDTRFGRGYVPSWEAAVKDDAVEGGVGWRAGRAARRRTTSRGVLACGRRTFGLRRWIRV